MADSNAYDETITIHGPVTAASRKYIEEVIQAAQNQGRELLSMGQDPRLFTGRQADGSQRRAQEQAARSEHAVAQPSPEAAWGAALGDRAAAIASNQPARLGLGSIEAQEIRRAQAYGGQTPLAGYGFAEQRDATGKVVDARAELADALCSMLSDFAGERGASEGAVECLERLLVELRRFRQHIGGDLRKWVHEGPSERGLFSWTPGDVDRILKDLEATTRALEAERAKRQLSRGEPGKMFSRETIVGVLRGRRADAEMDCPGSPRSNELAYLIRIFENLE